MNKKEKKAIAGMIDKAIVRERNRVIIIFYSRSQHYQKLKARLGL